MAEPSRTGHEYHDIRVEGGRSHFGDVYNHGESTDQRDVRAILDSLSYPGMTDRRDALAEAHEGTFDWTFLEGEIELLTHREVLNNRAFDTYETVDLSFSKWLQSSDEGLYVVLGKPGSGKSTFMKTLATKSELDDTLQGWAGESKLLRAEHAVWLLGAPMQKSLEGILRALLHSALLELSLSGGNDAIEMIKQVCQDSRRSSSSFRSWSCGSLKQMIRRMTLLPGVKTFFLIDALDECEPQDRLGELAAEILWISQLPNVKVCVSCRPWTQFTRPFKEAPILHLDRLTYHDMATYIEHRLMSAEAEHDLASDFRDGSTAAKALIYSVADAASGVFLWVELALKELCSKTRKGRTVRELRRSATSFPTNLDDYFRHLIFERIGKTRENALETAAVLKLAMTVHTYKHKGINRWHPLFQKSFFDFWLLKEGRLEKGFSWAKHEERSYSTLDINRMQRETRAFLAETCNDLLVLNETLSTVDYFHRSVFDFLADSTISDFIEQDAPAHFQDKSFVVELAMLRAICMLRQDDLHVRNCYTRNFVMEMCATTYLITDRQYDHSRWLATCDDLVASAIRKDYGLSTSTIWCQPALYALHSRPQDTPIPKERR